MVFGKTTSATIPSALELGQPATAVPVAVGVGALQILVGDLVGGGPGVEVVVVALRQIGPVVEQVAAPVAVGRDQDVVVVRVHPPVVPFSVSAVTLTSVAAGLRSPDPRSVKGRPARPRGVRTELVARSDVAPHGSPKAARPFRADPACTSRRHRRGRPPGRRAGGSLGPDHAPSGRRAGRGGDRHLLARGQPRRVGGPPRRSASSRTWVTSTPPGALPGSRVAGLAHELRARLLARPHLIALADQRGMTAAMFQPVQAALAEELATIGVSGRRAGKVIQMLQCHVVASVVLARAVDRSQAQDTTRPSSGRAGRRTPISSRRSPPSPTSTPPSPSGSTPSSTDCSRSRTRPRRPRLRVEGRATSGWRRCGPTDGAAGSARMDGVRVHLVDGTYELVPPFLRVPLAPDSGRGRGGGHARGAPVGLAPAGRRRHPCRCGDRPCHRVVPQRSLARLQDRGRHRPEPVVPVLATRGGARRHGRRGLAHGRARGGRCHGQRRRRRRGRPVRRTGPHLHTGQGPRPVRPGQPGGATRPAKEPERDPRRGGGDGQVRRTARPPSPTTCPSSATAPTACPACQGGEPSRLRRSSSDGVHVEDIPADPRRVGRHRARARPRSRPPCASATRTPSSSSTWPPCGSTGRSSVRSTSCAGSGPTADFEAVCDVLDRAPAGTASRGARRRTGLTRRAATRPGNSSSERQRHHMRAKRKAA